MTFEGEVTCEPTFQKVGTLTSWATESLRERQGGAVWAQDHPVGADISQSSCPAYSGF